MITRNLKLLIALIIVGIIAAYIALVTIPTQLAKRSYEAAKTLGQDFQNVFQITPEITVNNTVVLNQQTQLLELAVLSQNFEHRYTWTNTWMGSTKQVSISGTFEAKAGFDLKQKFKVLLKNDTAYVTLPEPIILSVESQGDVVYRDENGIWNWINPDDRSKATNAFITDARRYADQAAFVQDTKVKMEERLHTLLQSHAKGVVIKYDSTIELSKPR